jgi:hypothetical protein
MSVEERTLKQEFDKRSVEDGPSPRKQRDGDMEQELDITSAEESALDLTRRKH